MSVRVLLVDDDQDTLTVCAEALRLLGYTVLAAPGAAEALLLLEMEEVDIVVTDMIMPAMSGLRLLELITATHPELPVIILSGFLTEQITKDATDRGARALLEKPVASEDIARAIAGVLNTGAG